MQATRYIMSSRSEKEILINDYIEFLIFGHAYLNTRPHLTSFKIENEGKFIFVYLCFTLVVYIG